MPIAWAELPAPVQQLVYDGLGVMGVLALNREWRACRERRVAERLDNTSGSYSRTASVDAPPHTLRAGCRVDRVAG